MPNENSTGSGVIEQQAAPASESTAVQPQTETQTTSTSLMDKLDIPAEIQKELKSLQPEQPEAEAPVVEDEPVEQPETQLEENPTDEQPGAHGDWPEHVKKVFDKRVGKLTKQKLDAIERAEAAEEAVEQLRQQLEGVQPVTVAPHQGDVLADVQNEQQLGAKVHEARFVRDWCRQHAQGFLADEGKPTEHFIPPEEIASKLSLAEDVLLLHVPRKQREIVERQRFNQIAEQKYSELFRKGSEEHQKAVAVMQTFPFLANHPAGMLVIGHYLRGAKASFEDEMNAGNRPNSDIPPELLTPKPPIAPNVPRSPRGDAAAPSRKKVDQAMSNIVEQGGSRESLIAAIRATRLAGKKNNSRDAVLA